MKEALALACLLALPVCAQMQMPMGSMHSPSAAKPPKASTPQAAPSPQRSTAPSKPAMPFGQNADGDTSRAPRSVPATPTPVVLTSTVQEQENPERRTGAGDSSMPDLLADVKTRPPEPLPFFTQHAAASNPTLRQAEAQVTRLHAEAKQAGLWQNPQIGYSADHIRGGIYAGGEQGGYVQQTIPLAGQRSAARSAIEAQAAAAEAVLQVQRERVNAGVEQAFYAALALQHEVDLRSQMALLAEDEAAASHQFANVGQADAPDVLGSEIEREQAKLELAAVQREYRKAFASLAAMSGDAALPVSFLEGDLAAVPLLTSGMAAQVAEASPTLQVARQQVAASGAEVRSARREALPQLTVRGGLQQDNEPLEAAGGRVGVVGIAEAGITLPLWNRNQGAVAAVRARQAGAQADEARVQLLLRMQAEQTLQDYATAVGQAQRYRDDLLPRAKRAVELYEQRYAGMAAAYPQLVAAKKMLLQLQMQYAHALGTAWHNAVLLRHGLLQDGLVAPDVVEAPTGAPA